MYELFEHTADLGLRVVAPDLDTLFREAAEGLVSMSVEEVSGGGERSERRFSIAGGRLDWLLFDWLNEVLYVSETERLLLDGFEVRVSGEGLEARAQARTLDPLRHRLLREVKAITYHALRVEKTEDGWIAELIVDI